MRIVKDRQGKIMDWRSMFISLRNGRGGIEEYKMRRGNGKRMRRV
jgi:hypothetical protein